MISLVLMIKSAGGGDPLHPKEDIKAHHRKEYGGKGGAGSFPGQFQRALYHAGDS